MLNTIVSLRIGSGDTKHAHSFDQSVHCNDLDMLVMPLPERIGEKFATCEEL